MKTVADIIAHVGIDRAEAALGVKRRMINMAIHDNRAPASWFDALERLTRKKLPRDLFNFKAAE